MNHPSKALISKNAASAAIALDKKKLDILARALTQHCGFNKHIKLNLKQSDSDSASYNEKHFTNVTFRNYDYHIA